MLAYIVSTIIAKNLLVELAEENTSSKLGSEVESLTEVLIKASFKDSTSDPSLLLVLNLKRRRKGG